MEFINNSCLSFFTWQFIMNWVFSNRNNWKNFFSWIIRTCRQLALCHLPRVDNSCQDFIIVMWGHFVFCGGEKTISWQRALAFHTCNTDDEKIALHDSLENFSLENISWECYQWNFWQNLTFCDPHLASKSCRMLSTF